MIKEKKWLIVCLMIVGVLVGSRLAIGQTIKWFETTPEQVRLQDGMITLPSFTEKDAFLEIHIYAEVAGSIDGWQKTFCEFDPLVRSYYVSAPNEIIGVSEEMLGGAMSFTLDHSDDWIQIVCWEQNVVKGFSLFNAGRR